MLRDSGWGVLGIARGRHDRGQGKRQGRKYGRIEGDKVKAGDGGGSRSRGENGKKRTRVPFYREILGERMKNRGL